MPIDVDASSRRHHGRYRWLAALAVLATVAAVVVLKAVGSGGSGPGPAAQQNSQPATQGMPEALRSQVAARLVTALENAPPEDHHQHGHHIAAGGKVICAVDPFGMDPSDAATADQVATVYALHLCAVAEPGRSWDMAVRYSGPLAARLGDPPVISVVQPGEGYPQRVQQLIPERYRDRALGPFQDERALAELRQRFDAAQH